MASKQIHLPEGIEDHGPLQRRFWAAQRVALIVFAALLIACLLGAFGRGGYLSRQETTSPLGAVDAPRITRWNASDKLRIAFAPSPEDRVVYVDGRFFQTFSIEGIDPPQKATVVRNGLTGYVFSSDPAKPTIVVFRLRAQLAGLRASTFGIDGQVTEHSLFVFP